VSPQEALAFAHTWHHAVNLEGIRILTDGTGMPSGPASREADCYLFAIALRNFLRAIELIIAETSDDFSKSLREAQADFDQAVPGAVDLRNVLEHFDEYARGVGRLQKAQQPFPSAIWLENDGATYQVWVGIPGRAPLRLDIRASVQAAGQLMSAAVQTVHGS